MRVGRKPRTEGAKTVITGRAMPPEALKARRNKNAAASAALATAIELQASSADVTRLP